jgi:hypothetical protein
MPRVSLRELLLVVAFVALAIASLKYASEWWRVIVTGITILAFVAAAISAVVDRGSRQAFAVGMLIAMAIYAVLLLNGRDFTSRPGNGNSNVEFTARFTQTNSIGNLPTTFLLSRLYAKIRQREWYDRDSGEIFGDDPRRNNPPSTGMAPGQVRIRDLPPRDLFIVIGHCLWAIFLGFVGGRFARFLYTRRCRESAPLAAESS